MEYKTITIDLQGQLGTVNLGQQYSRDTKVVFSGIEGTNNYLKLLYSDGTFTHIPIPTNEWIIEDEYSKNLFYQAQVLEKNGEILDDWRKLSPVFALTFTKSLPYDYKREHLPKPFLTGYEIVIGTMEDINKKLAEGYFNPKVRFETLPEGTKLIITDFSGEHSAIIKDGYNPKVRFEEIQGGYKLIITDGYEIVIGTMEDINKKLAEGYFNPKVRFETLPEGTKLIITDFSGEHSAIIKDGYNPKVRFEEIQGGYKLIITDKFGEHSADLLNGYSAYELAVQNGFKGTVQEWLESLKYQHSPEFSKLAEQVKLDAKASALNAQNAKTSELQAKKSETNVTETEKRIDGKVSQFDLNYLNKTETFNKNATEKLQGFNTNAENKTSEFNKNATEKTNAFNQGVTQANEGFDSKVTQANLTIDGKVTQATEQAKVASESAGQAKLDAEKSKSEADRAKVEADNALLNADVALQTAIKPTFSGNPVSISDSIDYKLLKVGAKGSTTQAENPTPTEPKEVVNGMLEDIIDTGKNLYGIDYFKEKTIKLKVEGTNERIKLARGVSGSESIPLNGKSISGNWSSSIMNGEVKISSKDGKTKTIIGQYNGMEGSGNFNFSSESGLDKMNINLYGLTTELILENLQVEESLQPTLYEPYKGKIYEFLAPIELSRWDSIEDRDGIVGKVNGLDRYIVDGIKIKCESMKATNVAEISFTGNTAERNVVAICEKYSFDTYSNVLSKNNTFFVKGYNSNRYIVWIHDDRFNSINEFNDSFKIEPINIYFEKYKPTFEPLPEADQQIFKSLKTYAPNTTLITNEGVTLEGQYIANGMLYTERRIKEEIDKIQKVTTENKQAILSLGGNV